MENVTQRCMRDARPTYDIYVREDVRIESI